MRKTKKLCTLNGDGGNFYTPHPVSLEGLSLPHSAFESTLNSSYRVVDRNFTSGDMRP